MPVNLDAFGGTLPTKQGSISTAHTEADITRTLEQTEAILKAGSRE